MAPQGSAARGPGGPAPEGLVPITDAAFQRIRTLLHEHSGIALAPHKTVMVQSRLGKRLRAQGLTSYEAYLRILEDPASPEWVEFVNALTTNLTSFFREEHHFVRLAEWFRQRPPTEAGRARLWSAGCSTGEEPYSMAMIMGDGFRGWELDILATDLDSQVLAKARRGVYPEERLDGLDPRWKRLAFLRGKGGNAGMVKLKPEFRAMVRFEQHNLLGDSWPGPASFDAIFCRNVMIYFDKPTQKRVVGRFRECLRPGGLLAVGHSESLLNAASGFASLGQTLYQRQEEGR